MRKILLFITALLVVTGIAAWFLRPPAARTLAVGVLAFSTEFMDGKERMSYEQTRDTAQAVLNCYFNTAIQAQMEQGNRKYAAAVKTQEYPGEPPSDADLKCEEVAKHPIANRLLGELKATLAAIPENQTQIGQAKKPNPKRDLVKPCNFEFFDKAAILLAPSEETDYFAEKRKNTESPTYAAYTVGHCYQLMYFKYLETNFANLSSVDQGITWAAQPQKNLTREQTEAVQREKKARYAEYLLERRKTELAFDYAVQSVDTLSKTYPLHVRYAQLIEHSKEVRDQIRRFRVAMDQLVYKLINQTTPNL